MYFVFKTRIASIYVFYKTVQYGLCNHNKFVTPGCPKGLHIFEAGVKNVINGYISNDAAAKIIQIVSSGPWAFCAVSLPVLILLLVASGTNASVSL